MSKGGSAKAEAPAVAGQPVEVARRYATALLGAAEHAGPVEPILAELEELNRDVIAAFPDFARILASARVSKADKDRILIDLFQSRASDFVVKFLRVLNRHDRLGLLSGVVREARAAWDRRNNRIPVQVRTAVPLSDDQLAALRDQLGRMTGGTPVLNVATDPNLIGGLVIQVGDLRYDASVQSRLAQLRLRLIEGKTHEIQSRRDQFSYPA
jgi:F-type H+-transporting ATPase subunit delta